MGKDQNFYRPYSDSFIIYRRKKDPELCTKALKQEDYEHCIVKYCEKKTKFKAELLSLSIQGVRNNPSGRNLNLLGPAVTLVHLVHLAVLLPGPSRIFHFYDVIFFLKSFIGYKPQGSNRCVQDETNI